MAKQSAFLVLNYKTDIHKFFEIIIVTFIFFIIIFTLIFLL